MVIAALFTTTTKNYTHTMEYYTTVQKNEVEILRYMEMIYIIK